MEIYISFNKEFPIKEGISFSICMRSGFNNIFDILFLISVINLLSLLFPLSSSENLAAIFNFFSK